jgi:hypothetical protein
MRMPRGQSSVEIFLCGVVSGGEERTTDGDTYSHPSIANETRLTLDFLLFSQMDRPVFNNDAADRLMRGPREMNGGPAGGDGRNEGIVPGGADAIAVVDGDDVPPAPVLRPFDYAVERAVSQFVRWEARPTGFETRAAAARHEAEDPHVELPDRVFALYESANPNRGVQPVGYNSRDPRDNFRRRGREPAEYEFRYRPPCERVNPTMARPRAPVQALVLVDAELQAAVDHLVDLMDKFSWIRDPAKTDGAVVVALRYAWESRMTDRQHELDENHPDTRDIDEVRGGFGLEL